MEVARDKGTLHNYHSAVQLRIEGKSVGDLKQHFRTHFCSTSVMLPK